MQPRPIRGTASGSSIACLLLRRLRSCLAPAATSPNGGMGSGAAANVECGSEAALRRLPPLVAKAAPRPLAPDFTSRAPSRLAYPSPLLEMRERL